MTRWITAALAVCLAAAPGVAAAATPAGVEARIDRSELRRGEPLTLQIRLRGAAAGEKPDFAPLEADFDVLAIEPVQRTRIVNGVRDDSVDWTLSLLPKRTGSLEIPPLAVGAQSTPRLAVEVSDAEPPTPGASAASGGDPVFVEVEASDPKPYEQQRVIVSVRLWATSDVIDGALDDLRVPDAVVQPIGKDRRSERTLGGVPYTVVERVYSLVPQESGELDVPALHFQGRIREKRPRGARHSFLDGFFDDGFFAPPALGGAFDLLDRFAPAHRIDVASLPLTLDVRAIPAAADAAHWLPAESVELDERWDGDPAALRVGAAASRHLVIRAKGVAAAQLPDLAPPPVDGVKQYAEPPDLRTSESGSVKEQDTTVIPTRAGALVLPAIELAWWDVGADVPRKAVIPARRLEVLPAAGAAGAPARGAPSAATSPAPTPAQGAPTPEPGASTPEPGARPAPPWPALGAVGAALAAGIATAWVARARRRRGAAQEPRRRDALRALRRACRRGDAALAEAALRRLLPDPGAIDPELAQEVARLHAVRYSRSDGPRPVWQGSSLWKAYRAAGRRPRARRAAPVLPPLYPGPLTSGSGPSRGGALPDAS